VVEQEDDDNDPGISGSAMQFDDTGSSSRDLVKVKAEEDDLGRVTTRAEDSDEDGLEEGELEEGEIDQ
jgi:hypothetical protein